MGQVSGVPESRLGHGARPEVETTQIIYCNSLHGLRCTKAVRVGRDTISLGLCSSLQYRYIVRKFARRDYDEELEPGRLRGVPHPLPNITHHGKDGDLLQPLWEYTPTHLFRVNSESFNSTESASAGQTNEARCTEDVADARQVSKTGLSRNRRGHEILLTLEIFKAFRAFGPVPGHQRLPSRPVNAFGKVSTGSHHDAANNTTPVTPVKTRTDEDEDQSVEEEQTKFNGGGFRSRTQRRD
ncbi:hypothetical protein B0H12DRAFT_1069721 [Mycena haematopus]|nr:hypothetical protein B0H12DRAFT_1069721 [Mycena haematopus]